MNRDVVIIMCAGEASRWDNYQDTPKHLVVLEGESLLNRTVRLIHEYKTRPVDVYVVVKDLNDERYHIPYSTPALARFNEDNKGVDKFLSSQNLWNQKGKTVVLYGDVWFSDECIKHIMENESHEWLLYARPRGSRYTGCNWKECFGQVFWDEHIQEHIDGFTRVLENFEKSGRASGWEHYYYMCGMGLVNEGSDLVIDTNKMVVIDDFTDDFDFPIDYDRWIKNRKEWKKNHGDIEP